MERRTRCLPLAPCPPPGFQWKKTVKVEPLIHDLLLCSFWRRTRRELTWTLLRKDGHAAPEVEVYRLLVGRPTFHTIFDQCDGPLYRLPYHLSGSGTETKLKSEHGQSNVWRMEGRWWALPWSMHVRILVHSVPASHVASKRIHKAPPRSPYKPHPSAAYLLACSFNLPLRLDNLWTKATN
jgi:hypothetical protein